MPTKFSRYTVPGPLHSFVQPKAAHGPGNKAMYTVEPLKGHHCIRGPAYPHIRGIPLYNYVIRIVKGATLKLKPQRKLTRDRKSKFYCLE